MQASKNSLFGLAVVVLDKFFSETVFLKVFLAVTLHKETAVIKEGFGLDQMDSRNIRFCEFELTQ
jgi:hypothetical protein